MVAIIGAVVVGGLVGRSAIAAPGAGTVVIGGSVTLTAAPGWVEAVSDDPSVSGIELRKANADFHRRSRLNGATPATRPSCSDAGGLA